MSQLRKPFLKKIRSKRINVKRPHVNKTTSEKRKFGSNKKLGPEWTMNVLGKPFKKIRSKKHEKTLHLKVKITPQSEKTLHLTCEQQTTGEKKNFCSKTVFSLHFKIRAKKIHAAKPLVFLLHFLFRRYQNHYSNLTSKVMKMCEQTLK